MAEAVGTLSLAVELLVGALLLAAGIAKFRAGEPAVVAAVRKYEIGSRDEQRLFARLLPWIEIGLGVGLILGLARDLTALGAGGLLAGFGVVMARSLSNGRRHSCGCGGTRVPQLVSWTLVSRNFVLVAALALAELARTGNAYSFSTGTLVAGWCATSLVTAGLWIRARGRAGNALSEAPSTGRA